MSAETSELRSNDIELKRPKILIIGAGISGISCARVLQNNGFDDYEILEGTNRVGGRILSLKLETTSEHCAELGANWIHGIDLNPIFKLATENGLLSGKYSGKKLGQKTLFARENGTPVSAKIIENVDWVYGQLIEKCDEFFQYSLSVPHQGEDSVAAFVKEAFENHLKKLSKDDAHLRRMVLNQRLLGEALIAGAPTMHDISLSQVGSFEDLPGVHHVIPGGFEKIIDILRKTINNNKIRLNHTVDLIEYDNSGVTVHCRNGYKAHAQHLVCTIPLGSIKDKHQRLFKPQFPKEKIQAIERIGFGIVNKIVLEFSERVLPSGVSRLELMWDHVKPMIHLVPQMWARKIPFFEAIAETVLIGWLCGEEAKILEELDENEIANACEAILKAFLNRSCLPKLVRVVCSRWKKNEYSNGSYCYLPPGATVQDLETYASPVIVDDVPRIGFAGEATHNIYYSSSHGALLSGEREAKRIVDLY